MQPGTKTGNTFTITHPQNASPASNASATYRWSKNLVTFYDSGASDGNGTTTEKLCVEVKVLQN